jgi:RNA polymerase sigma-70 factor (ECF subfamily)
MSICLRTSSTFLDRLRSEDQPAAWERFVAVYGVLVRKWCQDQGLDKASYADAVQETSLFVFQNIGRFVHRHPGAFRAWLRVVVKNKIRTLLKRSKARITVDIGGMDLPETRGGASGQDDRNEGLIRRALDLVRGEFRPQTWRAFELVYFQDGQPADVAKKIGISCTAVYIANSRIRRRLSEVARELGENEV